MRKQWLIFSACLCLSAFCTSCEEEELSPTTLDMKPRAFEMESYREDSGIVSCKLDIERNGSVVLAKLMFTNMTDQELKIERWNLIEDGKMTWSAFIVVHNNFEVIYRGRMIKRVWPPTPTDLITLASGASYTSIAKISEHYDFSKPRNYRIFYYSYLSWPEVTDDLLAMRSNTVAFVVP